MSGDRPEPPAGDVDPPANRRVFAQVLFLEAAILVALWLIGRLFS